MLRVYFLYECYALTFVIIFNLKSVTQFMKLQILLVSRIPI